MFQWCLMWHADQELAGMWPLFLGGLQHECVFYLFVLGLGRGCEGGTAGECISLKLFPSRPTGLFSCSHCFAPLRIIFLQPIAIYTGLVQLVYLRGSTAPCLVLLEHSVLDFPLFGFMYACFMLLMLISWLNSTVRIIIQIIGLLHCNMLVC